MVGREWGTPSTENNNFIHWEITRFAIKECIHQKTLLFLLYPPDSTSPYMQLRAIHIPIQINLKLNRQWQVMRSNIPQCFITSRFTTQFVLHPKSVSDLHDRQFPRTLYGIQFTFAVAPLLLNRSQDPDPTGNSHYPNETRLRGRESEFCGHGWLVNPHL